MDKQLAIAVFCFCRQAERSIDFALHSTAQWFRMLDYYDDAKRDGLDWVLARLKSLGAQQSQPLDRDIVFKGTFVAWLLALLRRTFHVRRAFWFADHELAFIVGAIAKFIEYLRAVEPPHLQDLVDLRMDFWACQAIIRLRVGRLPELKKADDIEHFCHSEYREHVSLEECGVFPAMLQQ